MKFGILHLSDIHFKDTSQSISARAADIVAAAGTLLQDSEYVAVIVTGDIAYSGKTAEYGQASTFFDAILTELHGTIPRAGASLAVVPGNHDCDFDGPRIGARKVLLDALRREPTKADESGIVEICTDAQSAFFAFRDAVAAPNRPISRLLYEYVIAIGTQTIIIRCVNTAWMSQKDEAQGSLIVPASLPWHTQDDAALVITAMHHPYNWLEADNSRALRRCIEPASDLILTGHEHEPGAHGKETHLEAVRNEFIEGAVLQDSVSPDHSGFNAVLIDLQDRVLRIETFGWSTNMYRSQANAELPLRLNGALRRQSFAFSDNFAKFLDDPGVSLTHRAKATVTLDDIFVWPSIRKITYGAGKKATSTFSAERLLSTIREEKLVVITGSERSGKTTLCKELAKTFRREDMIPVLLSCARSSLTASSAEGAILRAFQQQYGVHETDQYKQLPPHRKVLLVDDIDRSELPRAEKVKLLKCLAGKADIVVVTASDLTHDLEDIVYRQTARESEVDFYAYRLNEFGHYLRNALIEKWFAIGADRVAAADRLAQEWPQVRRTIDTVVGKNFVPSYPIFILSILQAFEAARPVDTNASTYGYFYEVLVREALQASKGDAETKNEYLARLARHMFDAKAVSISEKELREFHAEYEREMDLTVPFARLVADLERCRILESDGTSYRFAYRYIYYYFVATHMRDRIGEPVTRLAIADMTGKLHVEEHANILLFLAHVCRDPFVIEAMLQQARRVYCAVPPARLEDDVEFVNASSTDFELRYVDGDATVNRRRLLSDLDELDRDHADEVSNAAIEECGDKEFEHLDHVLKLNVALKTIQILGQTLRNFAGSIIGDMKVVIAEECYLLGLRTLGAITQLMRDHEESVVAMMFDILRKEHPSAKDDALFEKAKGAVFWFAQIISYGMIKKVAYAVGSERLSQTYRRVRERNSSVAVSLIDVSLKLDHSVLPPEVDILLLKKRLASNPLAASLVNQLVIHHFYMFDVHYEVKQRLCAKLKISFETMQTSDRRQKLVVAPVFKTPKLLLPPTSAP